MTAARQITAKGTRLRRSCVAAYGSRPSAARAHTHIHTQRQLCLARAPFEEHETLLPLKENTSSRLSLKRGCNIHILNISSRNDCGQTDSSLQKKIMRGRVWLHPIRQRTQLFLSRAIFEEHEGTLTSRLQYPVLAVPGTGVQSDSLSHLWHITPWRPPSLQGPCPSSGSGCS